MVRNGNIVEAHQWDTAKEQWQKIGEVVDAIGNSRKQVYAGQEYDYVFDIDIGAGQNLKLPYNVTGMGLYAFPFPPADINNFVENPYMSAQKFIEQNELSQDFLEEIANFIIQNTSSTSLGAGAPSSGDPFTGNIFIY